MIATSTNQRLELAQVACPQIADWCGTVVVVPITTTTAITPIEVTAVKTLVAGSKCTWLAYSVKYAPTFTISKGAAGTATIGGLATANWKIHHMEYTA